MNGSWKGRTISVLLGLVAGVMMISFFSPICAQVVPRNVDFESARARMVRRDLAPRGITNAVVLRAMGTVPREAYVLSKDRDRAYLDRPLPIEARQTISQPFIVAAMTQAVNPRPDGVVLEVGTGSGYQAAVLAEVAGQVYTIEIVEELAVKAKATLAEQGYTNVTVRAGDGYLGWPEHAPFDAIVVTAAPDHVPKPLLDQLKAGGRMVIPVGSVWQTQELLLFEKQEDGSVKRESLMPVRFVPLTGEHTRGHERDPAEAR